MRRFFLGTAALLSVAAPALAAPVGFWTEPALERQQHRLWPKMTQDAIAEHLSQIPDRIGSRALTQGAKALLLAPVSLPSSDEEAVSNESALTALRLQKLLAMGGLSEAKTLADAIDLDQEPEPAVMDQVLLAQLAMGGKQAACLDLLAYQSETPESYEALSETTRGLTQTCVYNESDAKDLPDWPTMPQLARAAIGKMTYTLADLAKMSDHEAALIAYHPNAALIDSYGDNDESLSRAYRGLKPFKQSLVIWGPNTTPSLQWKLIPYALRHDFIKPAKAAEIYQKGPALKEEGTVPVETAKAAAKDKPAYARLPVYYKTLSSYKTDPAPTGEMATDILASGTTYSLYGLLPFTSYFDNLNLKDLTKRSAYTASLALALDGRSAFGNAGAVEPAESPWILGVLSRDVNLEGGAYDVWHTENFDTLAGLAPGLGDRLFLLLRSIDPDSGKKSEAISLYENKKSLTEPHNYVMHDELALSKAEDSVNDGAVGPALVALTQANGNISPDRLDPKGMEAMNRMLNELGLTHLAKKLVMESLVFRMQSVAPIGETTN